MTVKPTIACVIRTLNEAKYLKETIRRIYLQEGVHVYVIIVDFSLSLGSGFMP